MSRPAKGSRQPCPCCGRLTLPEGPGVYELCPVCYWEDDDAQLRWPMSPDGANGVSLMEAQRVYQRLGAMDKVFRRKVRRPRKDEPLDPGWRPFDPALDWTDPTLPGERWPANSEALYYWRSTYWNGDPHRAPATPSEPTGGDRLVEHLRREVPEIQPIFESLEWQYGKAAPFDVCGRVADVAIEAYRNNNPDLGLRLATALTAGLNETSQMFAPNCIVIGSWRTTAGMTPRCSRSSTSGPRSYASRSGNSRRLWPKLKPTWTRKPRRGQTCGRPRTASR